MSYLVLARKWRPQTFSDLVGQEHVSRTLANAIATNRVAHAFLFTGVRGVGKTTSARIMAKALNCLAGPTATPCLSCAACREIAAGNDVDVQEIDGASYNGVDEVRKLQETLPYRPARDRHKIFIVDEVHMLSPNAWNAFLKTLEEPPAHVKFIFATTEVHKVPITILSRCQRYDFKLIPSQLIARRLRYVLDQENIRADDAAIAIIAREASGSMRDAMSLLDQAIAWSGESMAGEEVARVLGVAGRDVLHRLTHAIVRGDGAECLELVSGLADQGFDIPHVSRDLLSYLRDLVVAKVCKNPLPLLDCTEEESRSLVALATDASLEDLVRLQHGLSQSFDDIARSGQPRLSLEMALIRLAHRPPLQPLEDLVDRLSEIERRLRGSGGSPPPAGSPGRPGPPGRSAPPTGKSPSPSRPPSSAGSPSLGGRLRSVDEGGSSPRNPLSATAQQPSASAARPCPPGEKQQSVAVSTLVDRHEPAFIPSAVGREDHAPRNSARATTGPAAAAAAREMSAAVVTPSALRDTTAAIDTPSAPHSPPTPGPMAAQQAQAPAVEHRVTSGVDLGAWREILDRIRTKRPSLAAVLEHASPIVCSPERLVLGYEPGSFFAIQATDTPAVETLTQIARAYFGSATQIAFDVSAASKSSPSIAAIDREVEQARLEAAKRAVADHPLVKAAREILGAELREIRLPEG